MDRGLSADHPVLELVVEQWPALIFLPAVLVLVAVLVGVTAWWERRDRAAQEATAARSTAARSTAARSTAARSARRIRSRTRSPRWPRTRCTCSWHAAVDGTPPAAARRAA